VIWEVSFHFVCSSFFVFELSNALAAYQKAHQFFIALPFQRLRNLRRRSRGWRDLGLSVNPITEDQACVYAEPTTDEPNLLSYLRQFRGNHGNIISPIHAGENLDETEVNEIQKGRKEVLIAVGSFVDELAKTNLDRAHFSVGELNDSDEKAYWLSKSPAERLEALELMRQMVYGYDPVRTRLQRVLTVVALGDD